MTIAAVTATLAGLMFVALTLHIQAFKDPSKANLRRVAEHTFTDFYLTILMGLFLIVPRFTSISAPSSCWDPRRADCSA